MPPLAQLELLQPPPSLPGLPDPPLLSHALLENPIPVVILALAVGLAASAVASRMGRPRTGWAAAGAGLGLGLLVLAAATLVQTKRERVQARTRELVAAVAAADTRALDGLLAEDARLFAAGSPAGWSRDSILRWVDTQLTTGGTYAVAAHSVREVQAEILTTGQTARTRASVVVTPANGSPTRFLCALAWRETAPGMWRVTDIEPLWLQGWGKVSGRDIREAPGP